MTVLKERGKYLHGGIGLKRIPVLFVVAVTIAHGMRVLALDDGSLL